MTPFAYYLVAALVIWLAIGVALDVGQSLRQRYGWDCGRENRRRLALAAKHAGLAARQDASRRAHAGNAAKR